MRKIFWFFIMCIAIPVDFIMWNILDIFNTGKKITLKQMMKEHWTTWKQI